MRSLFNSLELCFGHLATFTVRGEEERSPFVHLAPTLVWFVGSGLLQNMKIIDVSRGQDKTGKIGLGMRFTKRHWETRERYLAFQFRPRTVSRSLQLLTSTMGRRAQMLPFQLPVIRERKPVHPDFLLFWSRVTFR